MGSNTIKIFINNITSNYIKNDENFYLRGVLANVKNKC